MKRYTASFMLGETVEGVHMHQVDDGEWVKFEDVAGMQKLRLGQVNCGACGADLSKGNHSADCYLVKCNCAEKAMAVTSHNCQWWICPSHGYKRI